MFEQNSSGTIEEAFATSEDFSASSLEILGAFSSNAAWSAMFSVSPSLKVETCTVSIWVLTSSLAWSLSRVYSIHSVKMLLYPQVFFSMALLKEVDVDES